MRSACECDPPVWLDITALSQAFGSVVTRLYVTVYAGERLVHTPLHLAALHRRADVMALLLARGADVDAENCGGRTALYNCVDAEYPEGVRLLLACMAEVDVFEERAVGEDDQGRGVLQRAAMNNSVGIIASLVAVGANLTRADMQGRRPVYYAATRGSVDVVEWIWLVDQECAPWSSDFGFDLLAHSESHLQTRVMKLLQRFAEGKCPVCESGEPRAPFSACKAVRCSGMRTARRAELAISIP